MQTSSSARRILRAGDLCNIPPKGDKPGKTGKLNVSKSLLHNMIRAREFPAPVSLTEHGRAKGWPEHQVDEWLGNLKARVVAKGAAQ